MNIHVLVKLLILISIIKYHAFHDTNILLGKFNTTTYNQPLNKMTC